MKAEQSIEERVYKVVAYDKNKDRLVSVWPLYIEANYPNGNFLQYIAYLKRHMLKEYKVGQVTKPIKGTRLMCFNDVYRAREWYGDMTARPYLGGVQLFEATATDVRPVHNVINLNSLCHSGKVSALLKEFWSRNKDAEMFPSDLTGILDRAPRESYSCATLTLKSLICDYGMPY